MWSVGGFFEFILGEKDEKNSDFVSGVFIGCVLECFRYGVF